MEIVKLDQKAFEALSAAECGRPARGSRTRNHPSGLRFHQGFIAASLRSKTPSVRYYELTARRFRCICPLQPFVTPMF